MAGLIPYSFDAEYPRPASSSALILPGQVQGIYITLHPDVTDETAAKLERWFADRPEVCIVDVGTSDKQGLGFVIMEWFECEIDQLFLAILNDEETVGDYTLYGRTLLEG